MTRCSSEREGRRRYLTTVGAMLAGLAIGGAAGWLSKPAERVTETVTKTPTPTPSPPHMKVGFGQGGLMIEWIPLLKELGVKYFRTATNTFPNLKTLDARVNAYRENGIDVFLTIHNPYQWSGMTPKSSYTNKAYSDWVYMIVSHFKGRIKTYNFINEADLQKYSPQFYNNPEAYVRVLKICYQRAKEADPNCLFGMTNLSCDARGNNFEWIRRMWAAGAKDYTDFIAFDPYARPDPPVPRYTDQIHGYHQVDPSKPLWVCEFGYPTEPSDHPEAVSEELQAKYVIEALNYALGNDYIERFYIFNFQDDTDSTFGMIRADGSQKPLFYSLKDCIAGKGSGP